MKYIIVLVSMFLIIYGCKEESLVNPVNDNNLDVNKLTKVQIDLQVGFAGSSTIISVNNESIYYSILSNEVSLAGPEAYFISYIQKGQNTLFVYTRNLNSPSEFRMDSCTVNIGENDEYFIGLQINDSLRCVVQDSSFVYL